jgi:rSAM/selenodomain-associated transferase 2
MSDHPLISIIVPVFAEPTIGQTLAHLSNLRGRRAAEIIVVDGDARETTLSRIQWPEIIKLKAPKGRGIQMNVGARRARGRYLLFVHADTRLPASALQRVRDTLGRPSIVAGAFDLGIDSPKPIFRMIERSASWRSRLTRVPYGDQALFFERHYFLRMGGYRNIALMEDVEIMHRVRRCGGRIHIVADRVQTSARRWEHEGVLFCTLRNWLLLTLYAWGVSPERLAHYYRSGSYR